MGEHVLVIGGGLVGLATAHALIGRGHRVTVVEKEDGWTRHQSGRNSGVIHSGLYYAPGSLKARFATEACRTLPRVCEEWGVAHAITGKLIVATSEKELPRMRGLLERGLANGVPVREASRAEIREREPRVSAVGGLLVESTGVCDYAGLGRALARRLAARGAELRTSTRVTALAEHGSEVRVEVESGAGGGDTLRADRVVNCSGLFSDRLLPREKRRDIRIVPFRGEYWNLKRTELVNGLVYPVPNPELPFLGIHLTRGWDGTVHIGPNAVPALKQEGYRWRDASAPDLARILAFPGFWRFVAGNLSHGVGETARSLVPALFLREARKMLPELAASDLERSAAGVRAQAVTRGGKTCDDFVLHRSRRVMHVVNAPSPAATACLQIGDYIATEFDRA